MYLVLSGLLACAVPDLITNGNIGSLALAGVLHAIATLALVVHAISPFLASLLPWRYVLSLVYFPYYVFWKLLVMAQGAPNRWIATHRESEPVRLHCTQPGRIADGQATPPINGC
jgi:hypothetical protein